MATAEANLADPTLLQFVEMMWDKGGLPVLIVIGLFALIWKYGWPKFGAVNPPPPPNAVVEALEALREEMAEASEDTHDRLERIEGNLRILLDRGSRK